MNPFENYDEVKENNKQLKIEIWVETYGRKKNTYISGWDLEDSMLKDHLKTIKKKTCCNGTIKELENLITETKTKVVQLQGDHVDYIKEYLVNNGVNNSDIRIKG
jgi:translation initiation factor 1 (eIF-1/SUI1)